MGKDLTGVEITHAEFGICSIFQFVYLEMQLMNFMHIYIDADRFMSVRQKAVRFFYIAVSWLLTKYN